LALANQKLSGDELFEGAPSAQFYSIRLNIVRASRESLISSIWTRHPPTSCTIRCLPTGTGSSSTRSTMTTRSRWTPRSTLGPPPPGREVRVVNARPTPTSTHSADCTDDVGAQWLCARPARSVRQRSGAAGRDDARLVAGGTGGFYFRLQARASGSRRKWSQMEGVKIKRISPCAIAGQ
jgi:hypothetical protein